MYTYVSHEWPEIRIALSMTSERTNGKHGCSFKVHLERQLIKYEVAAAQKKVENIRSKANEEIKGFCKNTLDLKKLIKRFVPHCMIILLRVCLTVIKHDLNIWSRSYFVSHERHMSSL